MRKRRDGQSMCIARSCRRARYDGVRVCDRHYADQLWSTAVRARDVGCLMYGQANMDCIGGLQADHLISRTYGATRWLLEVGATLCLGHHKYVTEHPLEHVDLAVAILGQEQYFQLRRIAMTGDAEHPEDAIARLSQESVDAEARP